MAKTASKKAPARKTARTGTGKPAIRTFRSAMNFLNGTFRRDGNRAWVETEQGTPLPVDGTVSGRTIEMNANVDNVYYAGHLGPGSGLDLRNCRVNVHSGAQNWVLRNLSISCSGCWDLTETAATGYYGLSFRGGTNIYIDHSRFRWNRYTQFNVISQDGDVDVDGVTFSNSMVYDADSIQGGGQSAQTLGFSFGISGTASGYCSRKWARICVSFVSVSRPPGPVNGQNNVQVNV